MRSRTPIILLFSFIFCLPFTANAQNCCDVDEDVDLCYLSGSDYCGANIGFCHGYSLDGQFMINALNQKLSSPDNFGPDGVVDCNLTLKKIENITSVDVITDCGCDIIFLPNVFIEPGTNTMDLSQSFIPEDELQNIYDWSLECENNLVIATQGEANLWGYTTTNSNVNPNTPVTGTSLNSIFEGPFGMLTSFNQGGTFQGTFTGTPSTGFEILAHDANGNPTFALDEVSNDIVVGDIGIFCSGGAGVVSAGAGVNNNNDILIMNMFALACQLAEEGNKVTVTHEICPGETVTLPDGNIVNQAGIYLDTLVAFNGCDSIITTAVAYGIEQSEIFTEPDSIICQGDTIAIDGTFPTTIPIPFFENTTDFVIAPSFANIVSEIPVTGFGATVLGPGMIQSICIDVDHNWLDDLDIILIAPNGEFLDLTTDNGLDQNDYIGTCFTEDATTVIGSGLSMAPFTGNWLPEGDWSDIYGTPINGNWQLVVKDDANGFTGTLLNWSMTFEPVLELFYNWETSVGLSCDDCPVTDASPLETTTYYLTLTDSYGCTSIDSTLIEVKPVLPAPDVLCDSISLTSISVSWDAILGANGYEINIDNSGWINPNDGNLAHFLGGLSPLDTVEITVRAFDDCSGGITTIICSTPDCNAPTPSLQALTGTSCFDSSDGSLSISATGGSGGYMYELNGEMNATGTFTGLAGGTYNVMVIDDVNCDNFIQVEVPSPDSMSLEPIEVQEISCFGESDGSLTVSINAGIAPFTFEWGGMLGDSILSSIGQGTYDLLVTDAMGCTATATLSIDEPTALIATTDSTWVNCFGGDDGSASIIVQGGTLPYSYLWDTNANSQIAITATGLSFGQYEVTVTDDNSCTLTANVQVNEPTELTLSSDFENPNCFEVADGSISIMASGGTPDYTYDWNDNSIGNTATPGSLLEGTYTVTVSDENSCTIEETLILEDPEELVIDVQLANVSCFGGNDGEILVAVNGGTGSYTYSWDNGDTDASNNNLIANNYCVTVTDENACELVECVLIEQPTPLELTLEPERVSCDDTDNGSIELTISGGVGNYTFDWSNSSNEEDLQNLTVGNYSVTVTDGNGCEITATTEVEESSPLFNLAFITTEVECFGGSSGSINLSVTGNASLTTYQWTGPNNFQATTQDLENVPAGTYDVLVTDTDGCEVSGSATVLEPTQVEATFDIEDISCFGRQDGFISIFAEGGTLPYLYSIDGGQSFQNFTTYTNLGSGAYDLVVQDANGCEYFSNFSIIEPDEVTLDVERNVTITLGESHAYNLTTNVPKMEIDTIIWTPTDSLSCPDCLSTEANPEYTTEYTIQIITENGCQATAFTMLAVDRTISVYVPNIFSPNGDNINDIVMVFAREVNIRQVRSWQIFDRWGENVFSQTNFQPNDPSIGWDGTLGGKKMNPAVFTWIAQVELLDGKIVELTGDVTLVR